MSSDNDNGALVLSIPTEPRAYRRMREAQDLDRRLKREKQEVKEGKKKEVSKF